MAVLLKNSTSEDSGAGVTTGRTIAHTIHADSNLLMVGCMTHSQRSAGLPTGVKWNGDAMTLLDSRNYGDADAACYVYYLVSPDTGAHNVVTTYGDDSYAVTLILDFSGVATGDPFNTSVDAGANGKDVSVTYNGAADQYAIAFLGRQTDDNPISSYAGQTKLLDDVTTNGTNFLNIRGQVDKEDTPAANNTTGWTWATNDRDSAMVGVSIKPAPTVPGVKTLNGKAIEDWKAINGVLMADIKTLQGQA